ncbi:hypothetical protein KPL71_025717 [Citrus sinensis]|uniref:Uncharacterized protein n=1 Tax=Citrus sinensis TaxID=2711 RepID=A0ACB8HVY8_CITSI|nr:hypothetical protein KPL71_025717 [Citrus sinensis]
MTTETNYVIPTTHISVSAAGPSVVKEPVAMTIPVNHTERPEKFNGQNFKRWLQKIFFYLTTLNLASFLTNDVPKPKEGETDVQVASAIDEWRHSDFLCKNYVINDLSDSLYNVYIGNKTTKELWESLDRKYKIEDAEWMMLSETFQVAVIIEKLPPAWKDFKSYLKHKRKEMNIEGLVVKLRIEEDNKNAEKRGMGHKVSDCRLPKKKLEANVVENITQHVSGINPSAVVSEVNLIGSNPREWWIDTGATRHVCSDKGLFISFKAVSNGDKLFMGNSATSEIEGQGKVILNMTYGKELTLNDVLYVPEIQKNLVSGSLLNKHGFRMVFESDRVVLSNNDGLFKLNVMIVKPKINNEVSSSAYLLESFNL